MQNDLVMKLKKISDEWLDAFDKEEQVFSQGMFDAKEIMHQDVITICRCRRKYCSLPEYYTGLFAVMNVLMILSEKLLKRRADAWMPLL